MQPAAGEEVAALEIAPEWRRDQVSSAVSHAKRLTTDLNYGRIDFYQGVLAGRALWPYAPKSPVPDTCAAYGVDWSEIQ